jgi:hypothetical protein
MNPYAGPRMRLMHKSRLQPRGVWLEIVHGAGRVDAPSAREGLAKHAGKARTRNTSRQQPSAAKPPQVGKRVR